MIDGRFFLSRHGIRLLPPVIVTLLVLIAVAVFGYGRLFDAGKPYLRELLPTAWQPAQPIFAEGDCTQLLPELREFPEIGKLYLLVRPSSCAIYRGAIAAGEVLSAPGSYLAVAESINNAPGRDKEAELAIHKSAKSILLSSGWTETSTLDGLGVGMHAEFRRILPDKTRQYFYLETLYRLKLSVVSLPTPRIDLRLPKPATFKSHSPSADKDRFPELPPFPGLIHQSLTSGGDNNFYTPADPALKRDAYSWRASRWIRNYSYDSSKVPALAAALLYKDAFRDAGWSVGSDFNFESLPSRTHARAEIVVGNRELSASVGFDGTANVILTDIGFQREVAAVIRQWKLACVAIIPGLDFPTGQSSLSDAAQSALEVLLEARQIDESWISPPVNIALELRGRADSTGNRKNNLELAAARAKAVAEWLTAHGVPPEKLILNAFGDWEIDGTNESTPKRAVTVAKLGCTPTYSSAGKAVAASGLP